MESYWRSNFRSRRPHWPSKQVNSERLAKIAKTRGFPLFIRVSGFSLLEILIAVAIMAASFTALLASQGSSFMSMERAERQTRATFLAAQKMAEIEMELEKDLARNKFPDDVEKEGAFDEPFDDFRWKYALTKVEIPVMEEGGEEEQSALVGSYIKNITDQISKAVREVKLTVYWGDEDRPLEEQPHLSVTTHIVNLK